METDSIEKEDSSQSLNNVSATYNLRPRSEGEALKIAETVLKKRSKDLQLKSERAKKIRLLKKSKKSSNHPKLLITPQSLIKKNRIELLDKRRVTQISKLPVGNIKNVSHKVIFVIKNSRLKFCKDTKSLLKSLGLLKPYNGILLENNENTKAILKMIRPFVFYGYPSLETLKSLFYKSASLKPKTKGEDCIINSNIIVEQRLGIYGILCIEDIITEIWQLGPSIKPLLNELSPFRLSNLKSIEGLEAKKSEKGNLGIDINEKIKKLI